MKPRCWHCGEERDIGDAAPYQCIDEEGCWSRWFSQALLTGDWDYTPDDPDNSIIRRCMTCLTVWRKETTKTEYCPNCKSWNWSIVYVEAAFSPR